MRFAHGLPSARLRWLVVSLTVAACAPLTRVGADARWLAALGNVVVRTGHVPRGVPYAAAPSSGWHNVPVLGELIFSGLVRGLGTHGLILAQVVAVAVALAVVARGLPAEAGIVVLLVPFAALDAFLVVRAQVFSLALFPLLLLLLQREAAWPSRRIWLLVPLVALWTNLHGGVLVGLAVASCYLLLDRFRHDRRTAITALLASAAALFATPAGVETAAYYHQLLQNASLSSHQGLWAPPSLRNPADLAFLACVLPLAFLAVRARPRAWEYLAGAGLAVSAAAAARNEVWLVLFLAPVAVRRLRQLPAPGPSIRGALALLALLASGAVLVLAAGSSPPGRFGAGPALQRRAIAAAGGTPILADPYDAEQLALRGARIVIGDPIDAFPRHDQRLYLDWLQGNRAAADRLAAGSRAVLVRRNDPPQRALARDPAFCRAAADRNDVLYLRCAGAGAPSPSR